MVDGMAVMGILHLPQGRINDIMKTQDEIVQRIESLKGRDFLGFQTGDLVSYLDFEYAKPFLREGVIEDQWEPSILDRDSIIKGMHDYMEFAWGKANDCRGISAGRSMDHYSVWIWLIGDEGAFGDLTQYQFYGKDNLVAICNYYGWDHSQWDDGERTN